MALSDKDKTIVLNSISSVRNIEDRFISALEGTLRSLETNLTSLIDQGRNVAAVDVALARAEVERVLLESGYFDTVGDLLNEGYQEAIDNAFQSYMDIYDESFQFSPVSLQKLDALKQLDLNQFGQLSNQTVESVSRLLVDVQFGSVTFEQAISALKEDVINMLGNHARTWITTGMAAINREASTRIAADNGFRKYQYVGPLDAVTRPFCANHLFEIKTEQEWNALQDEQGQIVPVFQFGGGYNCRHRFVGVR